MLSFVSYFVVNEFYMQFKGAQSRLNGLKSLAKLFNFVVCNLCQSSPSLTILVPVWFIIISLVFFYYYFQVSFNLTVILSMLKITQNTVTESDL